MSRQDVYVKQYDTLPGFTVTATDVPSSNISSARFRMKTAAGASTYIVNSTMGVSTASTYLVATKVWSTGETDTVGNHVAEVLGITDAGAEIRVPNDDWIYVTVHPSLGVAP